MIAILHTLGGLWRLVAALLRILPRSIVDSGYDFVASRRYRWFGRREESCPLMTEAQRVRIDS